MKNSVETFDGSMADRTDCRKIGGSFYEKNRQCFLMSDGRWHRIGNGQMVLDILQDKYVLKSEADLVFGFVGCGKGKPKEGYFSSKLAVEKVVASDGTVFTSEEVALQCGYIERLSDNKYYPLSTISKKEAAIKAIGGKYKEFGINYGARPNIGLFSGTHNQRYKPRVSVPKILKDNLNDITFGVEFETANGFISEDKVLRLGLIPLKDGSLRHDGVSPFEYTTIPLSAKNNGLETLIECCQTLKKYTAISHQCSLHIHVGGINLNRNYLVAAYKLIQALQDEIYNIFPTNYRYTSDHGFKEKDYCRPLLDSLGDSSIENQFNTMLSILGGNRNDFCGIGQSNHPSDNHGDRKWQVSDRYRGVNFIPTIWGGSGTTEFRMHNPTQDEDKVINWLFILRAILRYAKIHVDAINKKEAIPSLAGILTNMYPDKISKILIGYIEARKVTMARLAAKGDYKGDDELTGKTPELSKFSLLDL